ncbi:hypothetical protein D3C72_2329840 [compost metagenome]
MTIQLSNSNEKNQAIRVLNSNIPAIKSSTVPIIKRGISMASRKPRACCQVLKFSTKS